MRRFRCACGATVFFESDVCLACGRMLGFEPVGLAVEALVPRAGGGLHTVTGAPVRVCRNRGSPGGCNWVVAAGDSQDLCLSCRLTEVIPDLDRPGNLDLWQRIEAAKRRLIYTLRSLGLPLTGGPGARDPGTAGSARQSPGTSDPARPAGLRFHILEDRRRNPDVEEDVVLTGHTDGLITVNLAEADDVARTEAQQELRERYRTVLGHLRHEAGHYYFHHLTEPSGALEEVRALFGDERASYEDALREYYERGAAPDWAERFLGPYASAHPHEDFAETFAHYLHIMDALETAEAGGFRWRGGRPPGDGVMGSGREDGWIERWVDLSITLNELNRSLGTEDPYPFVLTTPVIEKLRLMDRLVRRRA